MIEFRVVKHSMSQGDMVEVLRDGKFVASIYEHEDGLHIVSKHLDGVKHEVAYPPGVVISLTG